MGNKKMQGRRTTRITSMRGDRFDVREPRVTKDVANYKVGKILSDEDIRDRYKISTLGKVVKLLRWKRLKVPA